MDPRKFTLSRARGGSWGYFYMVTFLLRAATARRGWVDVPARGELVVLDFWFIASPSHMFSVRGTTLASIVSYFVCSKPISSLFLSSASLERVFSFHTQKSFKFDGV